MKNIKSIASENSSFKYIIDELKINSTSGRKLLLNQKMFNSEIKLIKEYDNINLVKKLLTDPSTNTFLEKVKNKLSQLRDIHSTLTFLQKLNNLSDVELFEIKHFALLSEEISQSLQQIFCLFIKLPSLQKVVEILDPENQKIPHFYIYSSYSTELDEVRCKMRELSNVENADYEILRLLEQEIEEKVRKKICLELQVFSDSLLTTHSSLAYLDLILAKAQLAIDLELVCPDISKQTTEYKSLFNPYVSYLLNKNGKKFQGIDIKLENSPCIITGANMGGKTILLKTVALAQYMFQFGFFVPAKEANISFVDDIILCLEDKQSEISGLSSFASEMIIINNMISEVKKNKNLLVLIDELARTTNPKEGIAFVKATIEILNNYKTKCLITTHYSGVSTAIRKLRVKGLKIENANIKPDIKNLNNFMDYSLVEDNEQIVATDGITIAEILGVDTELINLAKKHFTNN